MNHTPKTVKQHRNDRLTSMVRKGMSRKEIASEFNVTPTCVVNWLKPLGLCNPKRVEAGKKSHMGNQWTKAT